MSKKSLNGQVNMFDYFRGLEAASADQEVEMVSLMPNIREEESEMPKEEKHKTDNNPPEGVVMHKCRTDAKGKLISEISYVNYNKVILLKDGVTREIQFDTAKEAVDFYVEEMTKL